jgi:hypothetical protein
MAVKQPRRIDVGEYLTFLFETTETVRYQIQEMMRTERIVRESDIQHELGTYNALLGDKGELGCTLLIGIQDVEERKRLLAVWAALPRHIYMRLDDGRVVRPTFDEAQMSEEKVSAVQYLKFSLGEGIPQALGSDLPGLTVEAKLTEAQRSALVDDLRAE